MSWRLQNTVGPRVLMFSGTVLAAIGMVIITRIGVDTGFWAHVAPGSS